MLFSTQDERTTSTANIVCGQLVRSVARCAISTTRTPAHDNDEANDYEALLLFLIFLFCFGAPLPCSPGVTFSGPGTSSGSGGLFALGKKLAHFALPRRRLIFPPHIKEDKAPRFPAGGREHGGWIRPHGRTLRKEKRKEGPGPAWPEAPQAGRSVGHYHKLCVP